MLFAELTGGETSIAVIIVGLVLNWLTTLWNSWLAYKAKVKSGEAVDASKVNTLLIADNTEKTVENGKQMNGILEEKTRLAVEKAIAEVHAEYAMKGIKK